ncbi:MAG: S-layer homology domain-containing protein [Candidatus Peribacteraceae bacterium]|nr:S-layer homology domain-containing protein [Candidatus Peribacteraceae bacterium]
MKLKTSLTTIALLIPMTTFALDFTSHTAYKDVKPLSKEAAGINVLTNERITRGYANNYFGVSRSINRAEFLKMAIASLGSSIPNFDASKGATCFSDVRTQDWFSPYICAAKNNDWVKGYTDGSFQPAQTVSYGEALKMITTMYGYKILAAHQGEHWAETYYRAAADRHVDIPMVIRLDSPLTRGQVARLVAAFLAEKQGQLENYRLAEAGQSISSTSSSSSSSSSSSFSSVSSTSSSSSASSASSVSSSSSSSSSSASSVSSLFTFPLSNHFLIVGTKTDAIADGVLRMNGESGFVRAAQIKLFADVPALKTIDLVTDDGTLIASLTQRITADTVDYKQIYEVQLTPGQDFALPADKDVHVVARATVRGLNDNGAAKQLLEIRSFTVTTYGATTNNTITNVFPIPFPKHQTTFGRITRIQRESPATGVLASGNNQMLTAFSFSGAMIADRTIALSQLIFTPVIAGQVEVRGWTLRNPVTGDYITCSSGTDGITCPNIPDAMGLLNHKTVTLQLWGDVTVTGAGNSLQLNLVKPGNPNELGAVQWTDHSGEYRWIEGTAPLATGTLWK